MIADPDLWLLLLKYVYTSIFLNVFCVGGGGFCP